MPASESNKLIIFTRYPVPGQAKTRLIPALGPLKAAALQQDMTERTVATACSLNGQLSLSVDVCYAGGTNKQMTNWLGRQTSVKVGFNPQSSGDLGRRMDHAFQSSFHRGYKQTIIIGSDCPALSPRLLQEAFAALKQNDLVIGPCMDGGYYLIGLSRPAPLFESIAWGTGTVLESTLQRARRQKLRYHFLPPLSDIDDPPDLDQFFAVSKPGNPAAAFSNHNMNPEPFDYRTRPFLSIVMPVMNEGEILSATLEPLRHPAVEILIIDGGSVDNTLEIARRHGCRIIASPPSRAGQMNRGAAQALGKLLLFLHADTRLPADYVRLIFQAQLDTPLTVGAFRYQTDFDGATMRLLEKLVDFRCRYLKMPYGDQGLFMTHDFFNRQGGFPDSPIAEDLLFIRSLPRASRRLIQILAQPALTSARRHRRLGLLRTTIINQLVILGLHFNIDPALLVRLYERR